ncbi:hypothetical protein [Solirubrobacter soli]|uniref:hypothetical protein n=1 Tax=Solirubrobacter soli TaxID=363832 RepID=UPI0003FAF41B|nr:hypothetical protein [Solirubrobacter soli]
MALAFLQRAESRPGVVRFRADIGSSRYFSYRIGPGELVDEDGFELLADPSYVAPLTGPLAPERLGRTTLDVPSDRFDRDNAYIQLISYRAAPDVGPAVSALVHAGSAAGVRPRRHEGVPAMTATLTVPRPPVASFALEERHFSEPMFWESILPMLKNALPIIGQLAPMVGNLLGAVTGGGGAPAAPGATAPPGGAAPPAGGGVDAASLQKLISTVEQLIGVFNKTPPAAASKSLSWGGDGQYAQAAIAPALIAALPALIPLVEKALNPDTLKAIGQITPTGQANAANEAVRQHLERILPSSDTSQIYQLLALLATQESVHSLSAVMPAFKPAPGAALAFDADTLQAGLALGGRPRRLYRNDRACSFGLVVQTPRAIPRPRLRWQVKRATSADVLIDEQRTLDSVAASGPLTVPVVLTAAELATLTPGEEHVLCVYLLFDTGSGRTLGLNAMLPFTPVGEYAFDGVTGTDEGRTFALNDVDAHREYWHKVWQGTLSDETFRYQYECKYYYALDPTADEAARGVTRIQDDPKELHTQSGRLESSMRLSLRGLNVLLSRLGNGLVALGDPELDALRNPAFVKRFDSAGRYEARFGGRVGSSVALWVYPELKLASVTLKHCEDVDAAGRVTRASDRTVVFPVPAAVTFVGVTTET